MNELEDFRQDITEDPQYSKIVESAFSIIEKLRIPIGDYEGEAPIMPKDISNVPDYELGELLNEFTQWSAYLEQKLAEYTSYYTIVQNELEFTQAYLHTEYLRDEEAKKTKVTERKEILKTDKRYIPINREKLRYEIVCNILKANLNATSNICFAISRQISLKGQDEQRQYRNHNVGNLQIKASMPAAMKPKAFLPAPAGPPPTPRRKTRE